MTALNHRCKKRLFTFFYYFYKKTLFNVLYFGGFYFLVGQHF